MVIAKLSINYSVKALLVLELNYNTKTIKGLRKGRLYKGKIVLVLKAIYYYK